MRNSSLTRTGSTTLAVTVDGRRMPAALLAEDGWLDVLLADVTGDVVDVRATDPHGHSVSRIVRIEQRETVEVD